MRPYSYKNSIWKSSWYNKQMPGAGSDWSLSKARVGVSVEEKAASSVKSWFWGIKTKDLKHDAKH